MALAAPAAAPRPSSRWLFGPVPDLLLGCGLLYAAIMAGFAFAGPELRSSQPVYLMALLVILFSMPHYGATLVRVYEQRNERRRYALFAVHATVLMVFASIAGFYNAYVGALLVTLYLTWSPWHYTGQNYGLSVMFLRRRGVDVTPRAKRVLYASFALSYVLTFLVMHGISAPGYSPFDYQGSAAQFLPLGLPHTLTAVLVPVVGVAYLGCVVAASVLLLRGGRARDLLPAWALVFTQALWFSVPFTIQFFQVPTGVEPLDMHLTQIRDYTIWIWIGHAVQYLWVTSYYARAERQWRGFGNYFGKVGAAGIAIWTLPVILFAPGVLGGPSWDAGLALVLAAGINLHHFILDGAIWKLRNMRIASILIRADREAATAPALAPTSGPWIRRAVWGTAVVGLSAGLYVFWLNDVEYPAAIARGDYTEGARVLDRLAWFGRDREGKRIQLGDVAAHRGDIDEALRNFERSVALLPSVPGYGRLGSLHALRSEWDEAADAYAKLLELAPDHAEALLRAGLVELERGNAAHAEELLEHAARVRPGHAPTEEALARARLAHGSTAEAASARPPG